MHIVYSEDIDAMNSVDQLAFYRNIFKGLHCVYNDCGNELHSEWVLYQDEPFCADCFENLRNKEIEKAKRTVNNYRDLIAKTMDMYPEVDWIGADEE